MRQVNQRKNQNNWQKCNPIVISKDDIEYAVKKVSQSPDISQSKKMDNIHPMSVYGFNSVGLNVVHRRLPDGLSPVRKNNKSSHLKLNLISQYLPTEEECL